MIRAAALCFVGCVACAAPYASTGQREADAGPCVGDGEGEAMGGEGEGEGGECPPLTVDLVVSEETVALYLVGCECSERFATIGGCVSGGGDVRTCGCEEPPPSLTQAALFTEAGVEQRFRLDDLLDAGGVAFVARLGDGPVRFRASGCWGEGEIDGVRVDGTVPPACDLNACPMTCTLDPDADVAQVCVDHDVGGVRCCERSDDDVSFFPFAEDQGQGHDVRAVYEDGAETVGNVTVRLWRTATVRMP